MLVLKNIKKDYIVADTAVHALKGVDLEFRSYEFVAILGQSGCGKSTLLNIIGGLDQYTSGDLVINGKSTKNFTDGDWDTYRNHSIGFVFQSYNLIPHQTVLSNVELALTLSGVPASERRQKAIDALQKVGLGDQLHKKPSQMSGGQMQRVAIARALVNDPDILLADEPTGALDTETSVQIMDLLKDISKDKLIIMVTHNPELAADYASRIIKLKDGVIVDDSEPYCSDITEENRGNTIKKPSMSFFTALSLSINNLLTKKARTFLTAFAGSIGIIGIALIMSLSNGIQNYINKIQEDTLTSYPLSIEAESVDMSSMLSSLMGSQAEIEENQHEKDAVYSSAVFYSLMNSMVNTDAQSNNLELFRDYIEDPDSEINSFLSSVQYSYDLNMNIYAKDPDGNIVKTDIVDLMQSAMSSTFGGDYSAFFSTYGQMYSVMDAWQELIPGEGDELISGHTKEMYDIVYGRWPEKYDEVVVCIDENNEVSDLVLYAIGVKSSSTLSEDMQTFMAQENLSTAVESWSYDEICSKVFKYIFPADTYTYNDETGEYEDMSEDELALKSLYAQGMDIKVVGIIRPNEDYSVSTTGAVYYTHSLIENIVEQAARKDLVKKQLADPKVDVFSSLPFLEGDETLTNSIKVDAAKDYIAKADNEELADIYIEFMCVPPDGYVQDLIDEQMADMTRADIEKMISDYYPEYVKMLEGMEDDVLFEYVGNMIGEQIEEQYGAQMRVMYEKLSDKELSDDFKLLNLEDDDYLWIYDNAMPPVYSENTYSSVLNELGYVDLSVPSEIILYASTFEDKEGIVKAIEHYNETVDEDNEISYTDYVGSLMSSVTKIINVISYVLIAFVAISLVVSSIMIGIITYISVLERTKEIGILRAIGASKRDVSRVFNAETFIIGLIAGVLGILLTCLLNIPINIIVHSLTGIMYLKSELPIVGAVFLVAISVGLTFIAGLIPSGLAAKKDPVVALRSE